MQKPLSYTETISGEPCQERLDDSLQKGRDRGFESLAHFGKRADGHIFLPALNLPHVSSVNLAAVREFLLRPASCRTKLANSVSYFFLKSLHYSDCRSILCGQSTSVR